MSVMRWTILVVGLAGSVCLAQEGPPKAATSYFDSNCNFGDPVEVTVIWLEIVLWFICGGTTAVRFLSWAMSRSHAAELREQRRARFAASARTMRRLAGVTLVAGAIGGLQLARTMSKNYTYAGGLISNVELSSIIWRSCNVMFFGGVSFSVAWVLSWVVELVAESAKPRAA